MLEAFTLLSGRLGRLAYFGYSLLFGVVLLVLALILIVPAQSSANGTPVLVFAIVVLALVGTWGGIALTVKRLHDLDLSGWHYAWMLLVPAVLNGLGKAMPSPALAMVGGLISLGVGLYLLFWPGTDGPNRFGSRS